ncbi:unnamed protein product [Amoebophrya sp. A120]|nr:unnamed protein product [Amoebophrya sp. A120]|eukprot:GSA120T00022351001.1
MSACGLETMASMPFSRRPGVASPTGLSSPSRAGTQITTAAPSWTKKSVSLPFFGKGAMTIQMRGCTTCPKTESAPGGSMPQHFFSGAKTKPTAPLRPSRSIPSPARRPQSKRFPKTRTPMPRRKTSCRSTRPAADFCLIFSFALLRSLIMKRGQAR